MTSSAPAAGPRPRTSAARTRRRSTASEPVVYDFRRPIQLSREHSRMLQLGFDGFARQATTVLTSSLRTVCSVSLRSIEQRGYGEYIASLAPSTYLTLFTAEPMPGTGMLEIPLKATMACLDHMLGGPGSDEQPQRPLTEIESSVVRGLVQRLLSEMRYSLAEIVPLEPSITGVEYSPQFAQAAGAADVMVIVVLDLKIDDRAHQMSVCLPFNGLHPHLTRAAAPAPVSDRERAQRAQASQLLHQRFEEVPVDVAVRFRSTLLGPGELGTLAPGDVVPLAHPSTAPLEVRVGDATFALATAGSKGPRLAALIVGAPKENP